MRGTIFVTSMALSSRTVRISGALLISAVLIAAGYFLAPRPTTIADAASTDALLKAYAAQDTDKDGVPDWQEALYETDPNNAHSVDPKLTDSEAIAKGLVKPRFAADTSATTTSKSSSTAAAPTTLTDRFARSFFEQYFTGRGTATPSADQIAKFVRTSVDNLEAANAANDRYSLRDLTTTTGGAAGLKTYATGMQTAILANISGAPRDELSYAQDLIAGKNTASAVSWMGKISRAYQASAAAIVKIPVPQEASYADLKIANASYRLGQAISDMSAMQTDPLRTMLGMAEYNDAADALAAALTEMGMVYDREQVTIQRGEPGAYFFGMLILGTAEQNATKKP